MRSYALVVLVALAVSLPRHASAQGSEAFRLTSDAIDSLLSASIARDRLASIETGGNAIATTLNELVATRAAIARLRDAALKVRPHSTSPDETSRLAAEAFTVTYDTLAAGLDASMGITEKILMAKNEDELKALVPQSAKILSAIDEAWRMLPLATAALAHALVDNSRTFEGKVVYLKVTRAERDALRKELGNAIPKAATAGKGGHTVDVCGHLLLEFLNGQWWDADHSARQ